MIILKTGHILQNKSTFVEKSTVLIQLCRFLVLAHQLHIFDDEKDDIVKKDEIVKMRL